MIPARSSLQLRFALAAAGLASLIVVLFAVGTYLHIRAEQFEAVDLELDSEARRLTDALRTSPSLPANYQPWFAFARLASSGAILDPSPALPEVILLDAVRDPRPRTVPLGTAAWRVAAYPIEDGGRLVVAYDLDEVHDILQEMFGAYLVGGLLLLGLSAVGGWWLSGRVLAPVAKLTRAAEAIDINRLDQRVPEPGTRDELQRLAHVLNAMLARLEAGFAQARRFSADASHELRTPLTIMRGELDRLLHSGDLPPAHETRILRLQEAAARLQRITENLLLLARLDAGAEPPLRQPVDFSAIAREAFEDAALLAEGAGIRLELNLAPALAASGDGEQLRRLLLNLLDNAIRYNHPAGLVRCDLARRDARLELRVANTGPGLAPELRARLFARFSRGDPARGSGGHGLGLALAREIARAHGGDLLLTSPDSAPLTEFTLQLPALDSTGTQALPL